MGAVGFLGGSAVDRPIVGSASMLVTLEWWHMPVGLNTVELARSLPTRLPRGLLATITSKLHNEPVPTQVMLYRPVPERPQA